MFDIIHVLRHREWSHNISSFTKDSPIIFSNILMIRELYANFQLSAIVQWDQFYDLSCTIIGLIMLQVFRKLWCLLPHQTLVFSLDSKHSVMTCLALYFNSHSLSLLSSSHLCGPSQVITQADSSSASKLWMYTKIVWKHSQSLHCNFLKYSSGLTGIFPK